MDTTGLLPSIPTLPPISIADPSPLAHDDAMSQSQTTIRNVASHESLSTALELSCQLAAMVNNDQCPQPDSHRSSIGQSLRKSLSVDSFARYSRHDAGMTITTALNSSPESSEFPRVYSLESPRIFDYNLSSTSPRSSVLSNAQAQPTPGSVGITAGKIDDRALDMDTSRSALPNHATGMARRSSAKGKEPPRPLLRGGDLALPSRSQTISSVAGSSVQEETVQRLRSISSAQFSQRRPEATPRSLPGRPRSGSLGVQVNSTGRRMLINTNVPNTNTVEPESGITLAVVGTAGCGKSTVIRKALKRFGLTDATTISVPQGLLGMKAPSTYTLRVGSMPPDEHVSDGSLHVLEVEASPTIDSPAIVSKDWPESLPKLHGVIVCYDASQETSFQSIGNLLQGFRDMKLPVVVLACKSDLQRRVEPGRAVEILKQYDVGLVEVSTMQKAGKEKMRQAFDFLSTAIRRERRNNRSDANYRNPASPDVLESSSWDPNHTSTAAPPALMTTTQTVAQGQNDLSPVLPSPLSGTHSARSPSAPTSPVRARSTNDLLSEREKARSIERQWELERAGGHSITDLAMVSAGEGAAEVRVDPKETKDHEPRPAQWATLEELLDKLIFLAVTGDDPSFVVHFLLTYRRFATPRSIILAMQRRLRQLDVPSGDPMFACFGQMRICHLLESWIRDYPHDFAVPGTAGALSALIKFIINKSYLLHYGSEFLPFLELLPGLSDKDATWAVKGEDAACESDDSRSLFEDDEEDEMIVADTDIPPAPPTTNVRPGTSPSATRERKPSLPQSRPHTSSFAQESPETSGRQLIKDLFKVAQEVNMIDSDEIAYEISRIEAKMFLDIEPRHWLQHTFTSGKKDPQIDTIARFNKFSNHLASWVVSLILCHDKPRMRAKQIEKFIEVALKLRNLNNYSALRAFVAGINNSTFPTDATMEIFKQKAPEHAKNLQSWDLLFQSRRSHRAYRMALKNTKGACIPALEVHISDLIQAHEGNADFNPNEPSKVHWGKYNMIGKFISNTTQCQAQCRTTTDYDFLERPRIRELLQREKLMDDEMQRSRISPPDSDLLDEVPRPVLPRTLSKDNPNGQTRDAVLRRIIFW